MAKQILNRGWAAFLAVCVAALAGCGGSDSTPAEPVAPPAAATTAEKILAASKVAANDAASNTSASFMVVQDAGLAAVTVASPPKVNFVVFSDGAIKTGLTNANARFALAKLVRGSNGNPDQWQSYVYRTETAPANVGPGGATVLPSAKQATTDASTAAQLVYNPDGYYTYTFSTDITDPAKTKGVVFEPGLTHRVAIQLSYVNAAGQTVLVNPYFDFTLDAAGKSVPVTDASKTRVMADIASCNGCHENLALHGGGRVDVQYCVMCHNPGTIDANSGHVLTMSTMTHKIHAGRLLKTKLDAGQGGEDYAIWGYGNSKHDYAEVGFPQDLRNCTVCHSGSNPKTPQGGNWKTQVSKEACLTCHANGTGSNFDTYHKQIAGLPSFGLPAGAGAKDLPDQACLDCHKAGTNLSPERVHWNQNEEHAAKYKMVIASAAYDATARKVTVQYQLVDPTKANAPYNLVTSDCTSTPVPTCSTSTLFGNLRLYLAYPNMVGLQPGTTELTSYNNGGSGANVYAYKGVNDGSNRYTIDIPLPADSATAVASGTARVLSIGQVKEPQLQVKTTVEPRPPVVGGSLINVVVQNTHKDVALSGSLLPRREIVSNEKCNVCHGALGTTSGSNTLAAAFHSGARNTVQACALCHDANRASANNLMTNGLYLYESYEFKHMIHGIHGNSRRSSPFTHGNRVQGSFSKAGELLTGGSFVSDWNLTIAGVSTAVITAGTPVAVGSSFDDIASIVTDAGRAKGYTGAAVSAAENYAAEVAYPNLGLNCNSCHVNNSYKSDRGTLGNVVFKDAGVTDPNLWKVISPKSSSCVGCHDSSFAIGHYTSFGAASFGDKTQGTRPQETCDDCHASGAFMGVDAVHGQK